MNLLFLLSIILFLLMVMVGGKKGIRAFFSLCMNFLVILVTVFFMLNGTLNVIVITLVSCTIISIINLFYTNKVNIRTITAFISTITTVFILLLFISFMTKYAMIQGFGEEETDEISGYSLYIGVDFVKIATSVIIMSTIGAIMDVAISISTSMHQIVSYHPFVPKKDLFRSGLNIGRDILGTDTNTLFFAFFGSYLSLLIWFKDLDYTIGEILNAKVFAAQILMIFSAGIGIALIIPICASINTYVLMRERN